MFMYIRYDHSILRMNKVYSYDTCCYLGYAPEHACILTYIHARAPKTHTSILPRTYVHTPLIVQTHILSVMHIKIMLRLKHLHIQNLIPTELNTY